MTSKGSAPSLRLLEEENERLRLENQVLLAAGRELETARQNYSELFNRAPVACVTLDAEGLIQHLNLAAITLFGGGRAQLVGTPLFAAVRADDRERLREHLLTARTGGVLQRSEIRLVSRAAGGTPVQLCTSYAAMSDSFVLALLDLAELHAIDEERQRLANAEREARAANDAKDTFIAMLSHELRTPLTPVLAVASALTQLSGVPEELRDMLGLVARNVATEVRLIDDLLDLTRITHGKMRVDRRPLNLHEVAREVVDLVLPECRDAQLSLSLELGADHHWVSGDDIRLQQVFNNVLRNAIKFTPAGGRIEVRSWNRDKLLIVEVADNGRGIDPETIDKLFRPFEQALLEHMGSAKGLGLGLPITRGILEQHDARISVESDGLGCGARLAIEIETIEPPTLRPAAPSSRPPTTQSLRVLLVEDHEDTAAVLETLLRYAGYRVQVANSLKSALAVASDTFDLLLSDVGLLDGSGLDLMRALRETRPVPGIALSGYGTEDDIRASKQAGFAEHLTKPVDFSELLAAIAKLKIR